MIIDSGIRRTLPSERYKNAEWHWLWAERAWSPVIAQWLSGEWHWHCVGETTPISSEEMWKRGWRWLAVAVPPKLERDRDIPDEDLDYIPR